MMDMRCIALDDEPLALKLIESYCSKIPTVKLLGTYTDPFDALTFIRAVEPDVIFLDIQMPDFSGIDIAGVIKKNTLIIFTTAYKQYAVDGFNLDVVDFLLKPFDFERFQVAIHKAEERLKHLRDGKSPYTSDNEQRNLMENPEEQITFKYNYQRHKIPVNSILYVEAYDNYVKIITPQKVYQPLMTLKNFEQLLPEGKFVRIHKSFLVPVEKISSYNKNHVIVGGKIVPIGRTYLDDFTEKMRAFR